MADQFNGNSSSVSIFKRAAFAVVLLGFSGLFAPAAATLEKDTSWNKLIAEAVKHGGVETIMDKPFKASSYVFGGPDGLTVTIMRRFDNRRRYVCAMYLNANISVCRNWDTEKVAYATRANESAPWVSSDVPPAAPEFTPETPWWVDLITEILDEDDDDFHSWDHGGWHHGGGGHGGGGHGFGSRRR